MAYHKKTGVLWFRPSGIQALALLLLLFCHPFQVAAATGQELVCPGTEIAVISSSAAEGSMVCHAVQKVLAYSKSLGLTVEPKLKLMLNKRLAASHLGLAYGLFRPDEQRIMLVSVEDCEDCMSGGKLFGLEMDSDLYMSMVIHELAHAIADANSQGVKIPRVFHEYFAYVFQLQLMREQTRNRVLETNLMPAFEPGDEITETYYLLAPDKFAVKVYLHYANLDDKTAAIRRILNGKSP